MIRQIRQLERYPPSHVKADAADAVDIRSPAQMQGRGEPWEKIFVRGSQKSFDENPWLDGTYRRSLKSIASERVARFGDERIKTEKFSRWKQTDDRLSLIATIGHPSDSRDEQVNKLGWLVLIENNFILLEGFYSETSRELV